MRANTTVRLVVALVLILVGSLGIWQSSDPGLITGLFVYSDEISFVAPTPDNDSTYNTPSLWINVSSTSNVTNVKLEWGGMNESMVQSGPYSYAQKNSTGNFAYRVYGSIGGQNIATSLQTVRHGWINTSPIPNTDLIEDTPMSSIDLFQYIGSHTALSALTYDLTTSNNKVACAINAASEITCTPQPNVTGRTDITVQITDGPVSTSETFTVNITPVDDKPYLIYPLPSIKLREHRNTTVDLGDYFLEVDGEPLNYTPVNNTYVHGEVNGDLLWILPQQVAITDLEIIVYDGVTNTSFLIPVNITHNNAPIPYDKPKIIEWTENNIGSVRLSTLFYDPDTDPITYNLSNVPDMTVSISAKTAYFIPDVGMTGDRTLVVTASDGQFKVSRSITLRVSKLNTTEIVPVETAPVTTPVTDPTPVETIEVTFPPITWNEEENATLDLTSVIPINELNAETLSISVTGLTSVSGDIQGTTVSFTPELNFFGEETAQIHVMDGTKAYDGSVLLTVVNKEDQLTSKELPYIMLDENNTQVIVNLADYFSDPDGSDLEFDVEADGLNVTFKSKSVVIFSLAGSEPVNASAMIIAKASNGRELQGEMLVAFIDAVKSDGEWMKLILQAIVILLLLSVLALGSYRFASSNKGRLQRLKYITKTIEQVYKDPEMRRVLKNQAKDHKKAIPIQHKIQVNAKKVVDKLMEIWSGLTGHADRRIEPKAFRNETLYMKETISSIRAIMSSTKDPLIKSALAAEKARIMRAYHSLQGQPELDRDTMRKLLLYAMESASALQEISAVSEDTLISFEVRKQARRMRKIMNTVQYKLDSTYKK
ncbi:MAG: hypothetical protein ACE5FT_01135 [Candidatus Nanoarchaeia archaeon]